MNVVPSLIMILGALTVLTAPAGAQTQPSPPLPSPTVPVELPNPLPPQGPACSPFVAPGPAASTPIPGPRSAKSGPPLVIRLKDKKESILPDEDGLAPFSGGTIRVKADKGLLRAGLAGSVNAYATVCCHSKNTTRVRLVQVFEVVPDDPTDPRAVLTLSAQLDGYVRSDERGSGCLRAASAAIYPGTGGPPIGLSLPPICSAGGPEYRHTPSAQLPPVTLPAGQFALVADLIIEATADGFNKGHGEAMFSPHGLPGDRALPSHFHTISPESFGFLVSVKATAP